MSPGVVDTYQAGTMDLSLVDPDNRRPVDYETRRQRLAAITKNIVTRNSHPRSAPGSRGDLPILVDR